MTHGTRKNNVNLKEIKKEYLLQQIEIVENIIKVGTNYKFIERLSNLKFDLFGYSNSLTRFKKETLYFYLEELIKEGYSLNLLDSNFIY